MIKQLLRKLKFRGKNLLRRCCAPAVLSATPWQAVMRRSQRFLSTYQLAENGPTILCATGVGGHAVARVIDSLVAMGLYVRGAKPEFVLCDSTLPACEAAMFVNFSDPGEFAHHGPSKTLCGNCFSAGRTFYAPLPIPLHTYADLIAADVVQQSLATVQHLSVVDCFQFESDSLLVGEQARAGVLRFFGKATFEDEDPAFVAAVARRYLAGALVAVQVAIRAIEVLRPDCIVAHHGVYVPQGILGLVARKKGVRVINWGPSYRNTTVIYSHSDTYHRTFMTEPTAHWEHRSLSPAEETRLMDYLRLRRGGGGDWPWVTPERGEKATVEEHVRLIAELGLDPPKPTFGLLTNVLWDAQLYYGNTAFPDMLDWLFTTLDYFIAHPELQLIVRIHPHEVKSGNRQPTEPEIARRYSSLPAHIKIVDRDSPYSTYALMDLCRAVLIYGTKTGVELAPFGMPVIVAADAWIRNKGISYDAASRAEYLALLDRLPSIQPLSPQVIERARRYAYHYFFRRMIPLSSLDPEGGFPPTLRVKSLEDLLPGRDPGLDVICEGILTGKEFIYEPVQ